MAHATLDRYNRGGNPIRGILLLIGLVWLGSTLTGCGSAEDIRHYKIPKPAVLYAQNHVVADTATAQKGQSSAPTDRLLGAIVPHDAETWYFKMTGPMNLVASQEKAFRELIESLAFDGPGTTPQWALPESWQEGEGSGQRQATISVQVEGKKLEVSVIRLATSPSPEAVLDNVNRWRRQMQLPKITKGQLEQETELLTLADGTAILVNLVGNFSSGSMGAAALSRSSPDSAAKPASKSSSKPQAKSASKPPAELTPKSRDSGLKYDAPANWTPQPPVTFSLLAFEVVDGTRSAKITVSALNGSGGGLLPNVNRWFTQAGLPPISAADLAEKTEKLEVDGIAGTYAEAIGDTSQGGGKAIAGWIGMRGNRTWFVKISGDPQLVRAQVDTFRKFMKTLKFNAS